MQTPTLEDVQAVLGPQVDFKIWRSILPGGAGPITAWPAETLAIMKLRQIPSVHMIANGRNIDPMGFDPPHILPDR